MKIDSEKQVVGAIISDGTKILLAQRSCKELNNKWEFPGGKVEEGESHEDALKREINEELGIQITVGYRQTDDDDPGDGRDVFRMRLIEPPLLRPLDLRILPQVRPPLFFFIMTSS